MGRSPEGATRSAPVIAGTVCAIVGFTSSFAVVLQGLRHVGATPGQAASGLLVLSVLMGLGCVIFSVRTREPVTMAWSTPGAALLATTAAPDGGFGTAVTAFALTGVLVVASGWIPVLQRLVEAIPHALANAMLAGVLLTLCIQPFTALVAQPLRLAPVLATWAVVQLTAARWAVPAALLAGVGVMAMDGSFGRATGPLLPHVEFSAPAFDAPLSAVAIAVPLWLVTMTSQNIPGMSVLRSFGYRPRLRPLLGYTGAATVAGAFAGAHAINLAAISAALAAGPQAHPRPERRWVAGVVCGIGYIVLGLLSAGVTSLAAAAPPGLLAAIAGLALIGAFAAAGSAALGDEQHREAAALTFVVCASGVSIAGVAAAFWGLLVGLAWTLVSRR